MDIGTRHRYQRAVLGTVWWWCYLLSQSHVEAVGQALQRVELHSEGGDPLDQLLSQALLRVGGPGPRGL
jgi:hypothetical protein